MALRLADVAERDQALTDHVETTHYFDEATGEMYEPSEPPPVHDPAGNGDSEVAAEAVPTLPNNPEGVSE